MRCTALRILTPTGLAVLAAMNLLVAGFAAYQLLP